MVGGPRARALRMQREVRDGAEATKGDAAALRRRARRCRCGCASSGVHDGAGRGGSNGDDARVAEPIAGRAHA